VTGRSEPPNGYLADIHDIVGRLDERSKGHDRRLVRIEKTLDGVVAVGQKAGLRMAQLPCDTHSRRISDMHESVKGVRSDYSLFRDEISEKVTLLSGEQSHREVRRRATWKTVTMIAGALVAAATLVATYLALVLK
jgi:hypothetical protein